jgi:Uncharacterised protein family (UPF0153).
MSEKKDPKKQVKKQMHTRLCNIASDALEIAKNYECPEACDFCCKCNTITFTKKEYYGILSRVNPEIKKIIRENTRKTKPVIDAPNYTSVTITDEPELRESTDIVCPLLTKDNRCSIYENRPTICKEYPFILDRIFEENLVPVAPCDVVLR